MFPWPEGKRAALCVTFDMDAEAAVLAVDPNYARRPSIMTHQQYGPVTAVPRLLELLPSPRPAGRASSSPGSPLSVIPRPWRRS